MECEHIKSGPEFLKKNLKQKTQKLFLQPDA